MLEYALVGVAAAALMIGALAQRSMRAQVATLQRAIEAQSIATQQVLAAGSRQTQSAIGDVRERIGALQEQAREVTALARDIGSLQELLRPPKLRGGVGELMLERLLADLLPGRFQRQYEFPSTRTRVDAVVLIGDKLVAIDAKFPLDAFVEMTNGTADERRARRRAFVAAVKRHIDAVAERYIVPRDGTLDIAFLYVPSEAVYYELAVAADPDFDLRAYCAERRVVPVSPSTLQAFLAAVHLGLQGLAIQESARELQRCLGQLGQDLARLEDEHEKVGRHLDNARSAHAASSRWLGRVGDRLQEASTNAVSETAAQRPLPLDAD
ncbi:MAG TPA: DNA recombination protein RmuC [Candidatus Dormibacteraeota bacterium]|jgi:DNA recombination protein RmuC|nr:DNA recombination protein RmuC [Candidatus Dormibacteraeota bacterium]